MEARRSNVQTLHKPQSSKMQVKTASEVSLTPSQAAEQAKINARKNPLDALSRLSLRQQGVEKRSGLQDVDDEYFKKNMFSRSNLNKHSGLNDSYEQYGHTNSMAHGDASHMQAQQYQAKQQFTQNPNQSHPTSQAVQPHQHATDIAPQQQVPIPQPQKPSSPVQSKNQSYKESHLSQPMPTTEPRNQQSHQQQHLTHSSAAPVAEPELCTTCPNCQTTIYLVRGNDTNNEPPQGYTSIHHDTTGSTNAN
ncbi:putative mediator of RNA polymerase II transcription subunit 8 isoform X2 [Ceratitis capitata]|uniref:putative mediator of RNA polymerase II transcription subunit 8 isoform X2 n=1 Tax=Ceratitis capitata TaxID=7213 RepID=UPI00032987F0|nr:putative mediator of RNA polymerase II transcription subunit 8 isoform X2 [Ceratitis capitata]